MYTREQLVTVCGYGDVTGLKGANCYHDFHPFFPGISKRLYTDEQLDKWNAEENTPKEYKGKKYTVYEALQRQRKLETALRRKREEIALLEKGSADEDDIIAAKAKYHALSSVSIDGRKGVDVSFGKPAEIEDKTVANSGKSGIIKAKNYYSGLSDTLSKIKSWAKDKTTPAKRKAVDEAFLSSLPRLDSPDSIEDALKLTNPSGDVYNCQRCVPTYEMRRRGYDVVAQKAPLNQNDDSIGLYDWRNVFVNADWKPCSGTGKEKVIEYLQNVDGDARLEVAIRMGSSGHMFVAEKTSGSIRFIDPQRNVGNAEHYFEKAIEGETLFCRIDTLDFSQLIKDCIEVI